MVKYFICEGKDNQIELKTEITKDEFYNILDYTKNLEYYTLVKLYKEIVINNGVELEKYLLNLKHKKIDMDNLRYESEMIGYEANRLVLNYLASFRTFVDNIQDNYIVKINKPEFKQNVLSKIYDTEDVYAFFYKLRNFAIHYNLVFDNIEVDKDEIKLYGSKEHFLEYQDWNSNNKKFLEGCPENIEFKDYIIKMNEIIMAIYLAYISYFADELEKIHSKIINIMKKYWVIKPCLFVYDSSKKIEDGNVYELGLDILKNATDELVKLDVKKIKLIDENDILG